MPAKTQGSVLAGLVKRMHNREADPWIPLIDLYLRKRDEAEHRLENYTIDMRPRPRPLGRFSPSSVGGCQRAAAFRFVGMRGRRLFDPDKELIFETGNWMHHKWQALAYDMELVLGKDVFEVIAVEPQIWIPRLYVAGSLDLHVKIYGVEYIIDIKSANDRGFKWLNSSNMDDAREEAKKQVALYCRARKVKRGMVFYDNKNDSLRRSWPIEYSGDTWREVKEWLAEVTDFMNNKRVPPRHKNCKSGSIMREGCPFRDLCWGGQYETDDLRKKAYRRFPGIDDLWRRGNEIAGGPPDSSLGDAADTTVRATAVRT